MNPDDDPVLSLVLSMYVGEPCRICGKNIEKADICTAIFVGYSRDGKSRTAHKECWDKGLPQDQWEYPEGDEPKENEL